MTSEPTLSAKSEKVASNAQCAEEQAAALSHWQVLDLVYVYENGRMQISTTPPWKPTRELLEAGIFRKSAVVTHDPFLVPGHRFRCVLEALWRSGRVQRRDVLT